MSVRGLGARLARAEQAARQVTPRLGPETFCLRCGHGPVESATSWNGQREFRFGYDDGSPMLGAFELDGRPQVMPEAEARAFLDAEFRRRGWQPIVIVVRFDDNWQGT